MGKYTKKEFDELDEETKITYGGDYDSYSNLYNLFNPNENVTQPTQPSAYDNYMQIATDIYNQNVESNRKASANQAAAVGAEYRELQRNVNEINKANGRANTGYAGDTSIEGYNAYRNSLNEIYSQRDKQENDLYSYYMNSMMQLQQAKDNKEASDRDYEFQKEQTVLGKALTLIPEEGAYDSAGNLKGEHADRIMNYLVDYYGGSENIPNTTMAELNTYPGWREYINAYNNNETYTNTTYKYNELGAITKNNEIVSANEPNAKTYGVLNVAKSVSSNRIRGNVGQDNIRLTMDGKEYILETADRSTQLAGATADKLKEQIKLVKGKEAEEGDCVYYDGNIYVVAENGNLCKVQARDTFPNDFENFKKAVYKDLGLSYNESKNTNNNVNLTMLMKEPK